MCYAKIAFSIKTKALGSLIRKSLLSSRTCSSDVQMTDKQKAIHRNPSRASCTGGLENYGPIFQQGAKSDLRK